MITYFDVAICVKESFLRELPEPLCSIVEDILEKLGRIADSIFEEIDDNKEAYKLYLFYGLRWDEPVLESLLKHNPEVCRFVRIGDGFHDIEEFGDYNPCALFPVAKLHYQIPV